jgi:regulator of replication initiation timing
MQVITIGIKTLQRDTELQQQLETEKVCCHFFYEQWSKHLKEIEVLKNQIAELERENRRLRIEKTAVETVYTALKAEDKNKTVEIEVLQRDIDNLTQTLQECSELLNIEELEELI